MKTVDGPTRKIEFIRKIRFLSLLLMSLLILVSCYKYYEFATYNSIQVTVKKNAKVEYGSANYDINDFIKKIEGKIVSVKNEIDTNVIGEQEVVVEVKKQSMVREIPLTISVVDTTAPVIHLKEEHVTITQGDNYDLTYNIDNVWDEVDGDIPYQREIDDNSKFFYHFRYDPATIDDVGSHEVTVFAKDKNGNEALQPFILEVVAPKIVYSQPVYRNLPGNAAGGDIVSIARSLIGSPYVANSAGPYGFDCSGFVSYVYSRVGIYVSRSTSSQLYEGVGVPYEEAKPGDIISWGYYDGAPSHSSLYIGNGQMIHATNPSQGVIQSDVAGWLWGSGTHILSVRRIQ